MAYELVIYAEDYPDGDSIDVSVISNCVVINVFSTLQLDGHSEVIMTRDESISVSRAILKHFGEKSE